MLLAGSLQHSCLLWFLLCVLFVNVSVRPVLKSDLQSAGTPDCYPTAVLWSLSTPSYSSTPHQPPPVVSAYTHTLANLGLRIVCLVSSVNFLDWVIILFSCVPVDQALWLSSAPLNQLHSQPASVCRALSQPAHISNSPCLAHSLMSLFCLYHS